ncbi:MAG TPA: FkbM family methyltransferase [Sphingobacteriaceae bacterium]|nr:FkbM family methyltransferase [Sphingobacteriaceae bacterium]
MKNLNSVEYRLYLKSFLVFIRGQLLVFKSQYVRLSKKVFLNNSWYGNDYGGFFVYPDILNEHSIVYSFGIGEDISFDKDIIAKHGCAVFGFDPTPKSIAWIENNSIPSQFSFFPYGIDDVTGIKTFFLPKNKNHVSGSVVEVDTISKLDAIDVCMKSFADIIKDLGHNEIDVLKMDIEGSEYKILPTILNSNVVVKQILIEFHHRMIKNGAKLTYDSIELLDRHGYKLFAFSKSKEELSFIKTNYIK